MLSGCVRAQDMSSLPATEGGRSKCPFPFFGISEMPPMPLLLIWFPTNNRRNIVQCLFQPLLLENLAILLVILQNMTPQPALEKSHQLDRQHCLSGIESVFEIQHLFC
jgi:hypothetical protein